MWPHLLIANFGIKSDFLQDYVEEAKILIQDIDNALSTCPDVTTFWLHCLMFSIF